MSALTRTAGGSPAISVVMPVRDAAATLRPCLHSIQRQTLADWEVVAVDDGSEDGSAEILRGFAAADPRIRLIESGRVGLVPALNRGVAAARAAVIARMDADDLMHRERLRLQTAFLDANPDIALVGSRVRLFSRFPIGEGYREYVRWQNRCVTPTQIAANLYVESPLAHPSVTIRQAALDSVGGYCDGAFPEDYELWLRMHRAGHRMAKLPRALLAWRESADRTSRVDARYSREAFDTVRARFLAAEPGVRHAPELVIWGAGRKTRRRAGLLADHGLRPSAWVDIDPRKIGRLAEGLPVHPPDWLDRIPRPFVLVYVTSRGARDLIADRLEQWGYRLGRDYLPVG